MQVRNDKIPYNKMYSLSVGKYLSFISVSVVTTGYARACQHGRYEFRVASTHNDARRWTWFYENHSIVDTHQALLKFLQSGGHALVHEDVVKRHLSWILEPVECVRYHEGMPFYSRKFPPSHAYARYATRALRQLVFQRDEDRCRVCGRSPDDSGDIKLEVHHVVPFVRDEISTVEHNLITLCHTCHDGVEIQMRDVDLADKVALQSARSHRSRHERVVSAYREEMRKFCEFEGVYEPAVLNVEWSRFEPPGGFRIQWLMHYSNLVLMYFPVADWLVRCRKAGLVVRRRNRRCAS